MKNTYQIIVLGAGGVGKTKGTNTLMTILNDLGFETSDVKPWTEAMVTTSSYVIHNFTIPPSYFNDIDETLKVVIYDMGGQFKYKEMWAMHAEDTDAIVAVVDMTRKTTLKQLPLMLPRDVMKDVPVRLIVNKADLYSNISQNADELSNLIQATIEQTKSAGVVDYTVRYKGEDKFVFNSKVYQYGDQVPVMRRLKKDEYGNQSAKIGDFEAIVAKAFQQGMPNITEHNSYLFGREFTLQIFDAIYHKTVEGDSVLDDDMIETAHNEAPPFISWGNDPDVMVPLNEITEDLIYKAVGSMLIDDEDLWDMIERLRSQGFNIDIDSENSWALTSAIIFEENPNVNYEPMHKAMLPPFFIKQMIEYNQTKEESEEENFFV